MLFHAAPSQPENNRLTVTMLFAGRSLSRRQVPRGPATATVATATTSDVQQPSPTSLSAALVRAQVPPCVDATGHPLPSVGALATVTAAGTPAVRSVNVRGWPEPSTYTFISDGRSAKAAELAATAATELCFHFPDTREQYRQIGRAHV